MDEAGYDLKNYGMQTLVVEGARSLRIILHSQFQIIRTLLPNLVKACRLWGPKDLSQSET